MILRLSHAESDCISARMATASPSPRCAAATARRVRRRCRQWFSQVISRRLDVTQFLRDGLKDLGQARHDV
jgi:hypothetical protein